MPTVTPRLKILKYSGATGMPKYIFEYSHFWTHQTSPLGELFQKARTVKSPKRK